MAVKKTDTAKVAVYLDRATGGEENYVRVGVNGKMYQVPCGKEVEVPLPVYEILMRQQAARDALMDVQESLPNEG